MLTNIFRFQQISASCPQAHMCWADGTEWMALKVGKITELYNTYRPSRNVYTRPEIMTTQHCAECLYVSSPECVCVCVCVCLRALIKSRVL